ncbi:MAG: glucose-1-phosphate cytidylyltransferase [Elusimicrobiaceae bacterium]|nr:glucose-1-phosphate cytidylyltransferase [Elusimicrobiaceae bacterium]
MKVLLLAGGLGTRLGEETALRPKPMIEIGGYPILWHIMKLYTHYGFTDFIILCGYKSEVIKEYFLNYYTNNSDVTINFANNEIDIHRNRCEPWKVTMLYTGRNAMTGSRIKQARHYVGEHPFMLTYGDGVADVDIKQLLAAHKKAGKLATLTAVQPSGRFGALDIRPDNAITQFQEKPVGDGAWVNGGFFVCEPKVFDYIPDGEQAVWEKEPLMKLAKDGQLNAYKHKGFWHPMDTLKDKIELNGKWDSGTAPWKVWND